MFRDIYDQAIAALYDAAAGRGSFEDALGPLAKSMELWGVQAVGLEKASETLLFCYQSGPAPPEARLDYLRKYHAVNPLLRPTVALQPGEWMHCHDQFGEGFVAQSPFYQEFLIPHGGRYVSATKVMEDDEVMVLFTAIRGIGRPPLSADDIDVLDRVRTHLRHALENHQYVRSASGDFSTATRLIDEFSYPIFLVDERRNIRFANTAARNSLPSMDYLVVRSGVLTCRDPECDLHLSTAIRVLNLSGNPVHTNATPARRFVRIKKANGVPVGLYALAISPEGAMGAFGSTPLAMLIFHDPERRSELDPFIVARMFDLSPAESKIAVALAQGRSPDDIAIAGGISVSTVRAQIKSIFAKTGARRQSELVALLRGMPRISS